MIKVGLTGNIGSGKSTVIMIFSSLGIPVFVADIEAKRLYSDENVRENIKNLFGNKVFDEKGFIDFNKLASIIFNDKFALSQVNKLIHPLVLDKYERWLLKNNQYNYTVHESAILFENNLQHLFDKIITVSAPENIRIDRILKRDNTDREAILSRMNNQISDKEKCLQSDFVIVNDGVKMLIPQVIEINRLLTNK